MKIFIPSKGRAASLKTPALLAGADYRLVLHDNEERDRYVRFNASLADKIVTSNISNGISGQRKFIMDNFVEEGEWICMMDDNIRAFNKFPDEIYNLDELPYDATKRYGWEHTYCDFNTMLKVFDEMIAKAEETGTAYCGVGSILNAFFRKKKWKEISLVVGKICLIKKTSGIEFDTNINTMEDYDFAVQNMIRFGKVLVNSYVFPVATHYQPGGCGSLAQRAPSQKKNAEYLMNKYPGLFRYKNRANSMENCEICLRTYTEKGINKWIASTRNAQ